MRNSIVCTIMLILISFNSSEGMMDFFDDQCKEKGISGTTLQSVSRISEHNVLEKSDISSKSQNGRKISIKMSTGLRYISFNSIENSLDLHGVKGPKEGKREFFTFMWESIQNNVSKVEVITGRGAHSNLPEGEYGILSKSLPSWIKEKSWIETTVKKCTLSCYGGRYTIELKTKEEFPREWVDLLPFSIKTKLREDAKRKSKTFCRCFRNQKYKDKFIIRNGLSEALYEMN